MRKFLFLVLGVLLVAANLIAQDHSNVTEKTVKDQITLVSDVRVGVTVLKAGEYRVVCDTVKISFTRVGDNKAAVVVPCKGQELRQPTRATEVHTAVDQSGVRFLEKLLLRGSNIEHTF